MALSSSIMIGTRTTTSQAPCRKFEVPTTSITTKVVSAPSPLMIIPRRHPSSWRRYQRVSMPACDRVKATKTPRV